MIQSIAIPDRLVVLTFDDGNNSDITYVAPLLRKEFTLEKEIKRASVYISGLGYYELYDLENDPHKARNLVGNPRYVKELDNCGSDVINCSKEQNNAKVYSVI